MISLDWRDIKTTWEKQRLGDSDKFVFKYELCHLYHETLIRWLNVFEPQGSHLKNGRDGIYWVIVGIQQNLMKEVPRIEADMY